MSDQLPVDTTVISPVTPVSAGGVSAIPGASPMTSQPPMTLSEQTFSTNTEIPNYLSRASALPTPVPNAPSTTAAPTPTSTPAGYELPSVQTMFDQLKSSQILLSDITIQPTVDNSPLAHLQPGQLHSSEQGPQPAFVVPTQPAAASAIQLASTAPPIKPPDSRNVAQYIDTTSRRPSPLVFGLLAGAVIVAVFIGGIMAYRFYLTNFDSTSTNPMERGYDAVLETLPFVEQESGSTIPEAVWYQDQ